MAKKTAKSETLTIRMDPKTRFMLEFVSRLRGQTITTVVERAISEAANQAKIERADFDPDLTWRDFWSLIEGERAIKIAGEPELHPTYEEERRLAFTRRFWPFFYINRKATIVRDDYMEVLWGRIDHLIETYDEYRETNANAAPEIMSAFLTDAHIEPPIWPPPPERKPLSREMDDDIPF